MFTLAENFRKIESGLLHFKAYFYVYMTHFIQVGVVSLSFYDSLTCLKNCTVIIVNALVPDVH